MKGLILNHSGYGEEPHIFENVEFPFEVEISGNYGNLILVLGSELIKAGAAQLGDRDGFAPDEEYPFSRGTEVRIVKI